MSLFYLTHTNWGIVLQSLIKSRRTYGLSACGRHLDWKELHVTNEHDIVVNQYRALHAVKPFFFPVREEVTQNTGERPAALIGVKSCDLSQLKTTDAIFLGGVLSDPYYAKKRENTLIISSDCDAMLPTCFCCRMGVHPYPERGFDLNLSFVRAGFVVETGSPAGEALIAERRRLFQEPQPHHLDERASQRERTSAMVIKANERFTWETPRTVVSQGYDSPQWKTGIAGTCVECDACRYACGTCYCFLLSEGVSSGDRVRTWDSCQSAGYGRVAGGGNPRKSRAERLRNLYMCKMVHRWDNFGHYACTGCGRCIAACQGKIDIRESLQKLMP